VRSASRQFGRLQTAQPAPGLQRRPVRRLSAGHEVPWPVRRRASGSDGRALPEQEEEMTPPSGDVRIVGVDAAVEHAAIVARFTLGGRPVDPQWQGAFGRAIEGRLDGIAGRWQLDRRGVGVTQVEPASAARVAAVVADAVQAANAYVDGVREAASADREAVSRLDAELRIQLQTAEAAMRAQLGFADDAPGDDVARERFDDESPAVHPLHEAAGRHPER
jgi:hypothetical protein